jgi:branched-chain amino acid transport system ATP-binding protein
MSQQAILETRGLSKSFGGVNAVDNVSFKLTPGEIVGLIGPNGAGKTTLVNLMTGLHAPTAGIVLFAGKDITRQKPHHTARNGLARTFQIVQPFPEMTVLDNVAAAALFSRNMDSIEHARAEAHQHLAFVGLEAVAETSASALTLPNRKRLELAKSLAMSPRVLLLDEVNAGLNTGEIDAALDLIRQIAARGVTILVIEHVMKVIFSLSNRILVLHQGRLIADGLPEEVSNNDLVIRAYLGARFADRQRSS